ncbi:MAG: DUF1697 domain-containing protein, partial [Thermoplasmata archaeon]
MTRYAAFLRGINVGGCTVTMAVLRKRFEALGLEGVDTFRASGNVVFETSPRDLERVRRRLVSDLVERLGEGVDLFVRSASELEAIRWLDPFRPAPRTPATPYVTFLGDPPTATFSVPARSRRGDVKVFRVQGREVYSWG